MKAQTPQRELSGKKKRILRLAAIIFLFLFFFICNILSFAQNPSEKLDDSQIGIIPIPGWFEVTLESGQILIDTLTLYNPDSVPYEFAIWISHGAPGRTSRHPHTEPFYSKYRVPGPFDLQFSFSLPGSGTIGAEFDGSYYITRWNSPLVHKFDLSGNLVEEFSIPGINRLYDLAFDGTFMYGGAGGNTIFQMDFATKTLIGTINAPVGVRHIAYDEGADGFWIGDWNSDLTLIDRNGNVLAMIPISPPGLVSISGSAYDNWTDGGPYLWLFDSGQGPGTPQYLHQISLTIGAPTGFVYDVAADFPGVAGQAGGIFTAESIVPGTASLGGILRDAPDIFFVYELAPTLSWLSIHPTSGIIPPNSGVYITVIFDATGLASDTYYAQLMIYTNDPVNPEILIPVIMHVKAAAIGVSPNSLVLDTVFVNQQTSGGVHIYNQGTANLIVSDIVSSHPYFNANPTQLSLSPGDSQAVTVTFAPTSIGYHSGMLKIASNDPFLDTLTVDLEGVAEEEVGISDAQQQPADFALAQNYPNPFNPGTTIRYQLPQAAEVKLVIYNVLGQQVCTLVNTQREAGYHQAVWDGHNNTGVEVGSGVYITVFEAGTFRQVRKMILMK
jgi:hypothetical protein